MRSRSVAMCEGPGAQQPGGLRAAVAAASSAPHRHNALEPPRSGDDKMMTFIDDWCQEQASVMGERPSPLVPSAPYRHTPTSSHVHSCALLILHLHHAAQSSLPDGVQCCARYLLNP